MKKELFVWIVGIAFLLGLTAPVAFAQVEPPWPKQEQRPIPKEKMKEMEELKRKEMGEQEVLRREDIKEILDALRMWKMTKFLELTEEQSLRIFPKLRESEKTKEEFGKKRTETLNELEKLLKEEKPDQAKVLELLNDMDKIESEVRAREDKFKEELKAILSPVQQAKFYIFMKDFEEDVKRMVAEVRGLKREAPLRKGEERPFLRR